MSINKKNVRVRFAPSPTGFLHIGGLRTALYNYLFAKRYGGSFVLRIEDTDRTRYVEGGVENIVRTLGACGLHYDEGPERGGKYAPYVQSERLEFYKKYARELLAKGDAYHCFCSERELTEEKEEQRKAGLPTKYSGKCLGLSHEQVEERLASGRTFVVRLRVPEEGTTAFDDIIYGHVEVQNKNIDHQVLVKSDGYPTYHLANVVDDHLMDISHVIRGEEWLPSTPKHVLLYKAFGWDAPQFAHLPLILNPDKSKLSKRQGDVAVEDYLKKGYLPEALVNFIALLGWNPKADQEIYSVEELSSLFELDAINKAGAILNQEKLYWMNGEYIRKKSLEELTRLCIPYFLEAELITVKKEDKIYTVRESGEDIDFDWISKVVSAEQERMRRLDEIPQLTAFFFKDMLDYPDETLVWKKSTKEETIKNLEILLEYISGLGDKSFNKEKLEEVIKAFLSERGISAGSALWPLRVALSGLMASPPPFEIAAILGKEKTIKRIKNAIMKLS